MKSKYDVLVIGGGPAGALAAKTAVEKGLSACLVEKRPAIGARPPLRVSARRLSPNLLIPTLLDISRDDRCGHRGA